MFRKFFGKFCFTLTSLTDSLVLGSFQERDLQSCTDQYLASQGFYSHIDYMYGGTSILKVSPNKPDKHILKSAEGDEW